MSPEILTNPPYARARELLVCQKCKGALRWNGDGGVCEACGWELPIVRGVAVALEKGRYSNFDSVFEVMRQANREQGTWELFYRQQTELIAEALRAGGIVVDVGCGPELPYNKSGAFVIGVDASFESVSANTGADLRIHGSSSELPLRDASVDLVLCLYSIHHMTGQSLADNRESVRKAFMEFARVLKPGGRLLVFEASPYWVFSVAQRLFWNLAKRVLGRGFDMHFWTASQLERLGLGTLRSALLTHRFAGSWTRSFPPIFSRPSFRVPRIFYPFHICLYEWRKAAA